MFSIISKSIRNKILVIPIAIMVSVALVATLYYPQNKAAEQKKTLAVELDIVANLLAYGFGVALDASDFQSMTNAYETMKHNKQISYVIIFDEKNAVLNKYNPQHYAIETSRGEFESSTIEKNGFLEKACAIKTAKSYYGTVVVGISLDPVRQQVIAAILSTLLVSLVFLTVFTAISILVSTKIIQPIKTVMETLASLGNGDLTRKCNVESTDETGKMAEAVNQTIASLEVIMRNIKEYSDVQVKESVRLQEIASTMARDASEMTVKTGSTSASMTDTDESIHAISSSAAEMSNSIDTVTSSIQEMNSSLAEVSRNCLTELTTTNAAAQQANDAVEQMERLKSASKKVSSILDTITDIADQTNLLALNATIEAARAGAAGKSFAVVATEVKELARQTSTAVSDISGQIVEMQQSSNAVIKTVSQITRVIGDINAISNTISSAVEEQSVTMNQISRNMGEANSAASEIAGNVTASATGISGVKNLILDVDKSSHDTSDRLSTVKSSADKFAEIAGGLTNILRKFTLSA